MCVCVYCVGGLGNLDAMITVLYPLKNQISDKMGLYAKSSYSDKLLLHVLQNVFTL